MTKISPPTKFQTSRSRAPVQEPGEEAIRAYAYHLYLEGNRAPGQELDNWLEATACLKAHIPAHTSQRRLHHHFNSTARVPGQPATVQGVPANPRRA